jgi:RNA polymerase sigma factor (sigma-70 family)
VEVACRPSRMLDDVLDSHEIRILCQTILQRVAAGDSSAVDECLAQYGALVWSLARRHSPNYSDAEDAVQEAFLGIWQGAGRFDPERGSETTFITMIVRRRLIDRHRKRGRQLDTASLESQPVATRENHTEQVAISEEAALVRERMASLRPAERRVLELAISEGMSHSEIAESTSMPLGTVKTHARRGMIRLREMLEADSVTRLSEAGT